MGDVHAELREAFGERFVEGGGSERASVAPTTPEEVALALKIAQRHGLPVTPLGAGTAASDAAKGSGLILRLGHLRGISTVEGDAVEVEAGIPWVELEDHLHAAGKSLRVYPTSAPRSSVGGWLARNGLGVGSYAYGWLGENVAGVEVALPGGELRAVKGEELDLVVGAEGTTGVIVRSTLLLRDTARDRPFAAAFETPGALARTIERVHEARMPLWHLGFASPALALSGEGNGYVLFCTPAEPDLGSAMSGGRALPAAEAYRVWGSRFFPAGHTGEIPSPTGALVPVEGLGETLTRLGREAPQLVVQGSLSRSGEVLLISFRLAPDGSLRTLGENERELLSGIASGSGGGRYVVGLRRLMHAPRAEVLRRFKRDVDPGCILGPLPEG